MEEFEDDEEEIDSETEAMLYAQIYHTPLDFWDSKDKIEECSNVSEEILNGSLSNRSKTNCSPFFAPNEPEMCNIRNEPVKNSAPVVWISSDDEECSSNSFTSSTSFSDPFDGEPFSRNSLTNLNLHIISSNRRSVENLPASTSFQSISELLANFSVEQIQSCLPTDQECWKVSEEDIFAQSKFSKRNGHRYYRSIRCQKCGEEGHKVKACPKRYQKPVCFICGENDHSGIKCSQRACLLCFNFGHTSDQCKRQRKNFEKMNCQRCFIVGHISKNCSDLWRQFHSTTGKKKLIQTLNRREEADLITENAIFCYNCGRSGHFGAYCRRSTFNENRVISFNPYVDHYDEGLELSNLERMKDKNENNASNHQQTVLNGNSKAKRSCYKILLNNKPLVEKILKKKYRKTNTIDENFDDDASKKFKKRQKLNVGRKNFDKLMKTKKKNRHKIVDRSQFNETNEPVLPKKRKRKAKSRQEKIEAERNDFSTRKRRNNNKKNLRDNYSWENFAVNNVFNGLRETKKKSKDKRTKRARLDFINKSDQYSWDSPPDGRSNGWLV